MIVKKIPRLGNGGGFGHARHVRNLVSYMQKPDKGSHYAEALLRYLQEQGIEVEGVERLLHLGARNFLTETLEGQRAEMMATASQALKSPNPLSHWLISWKEHERPTKEELDEAAEIFLNHLGLGQHQAIYAAHSDTHNVHLHIAVNRYDPFRQRMHKVNGGFDLEAAHAAIAMIVEKQGWEPEEKARYRVLDGELELSPDARSAKDDGRKSPSAAAASYEARTGLKSAQRIAIEEAAPGMLAARSWAELHYALAEAGIEYTPAKSGAVLRINDEHVTASSAHRRCSHGKLLQRLGDYRPRLRSVQVRHRTADENVLEGAILADEFGKVRLDSAVRREREKHQIRLNRDRRLERVKRSAEADRRQLERLEDGGHSPERSALLNAISAKEREARSQLANQCKDDLKHVTSKYKVPADYEEWLRAQREEYLAERWRNRNRLERRVSEFAGNSLQKHSELEFMEFTARKARDCVLWSRTGEPTAFIEWSNRIEIAMPTNEEVILAGFKLAQRKYGMVTIQGPADFQQRAIAVILAHGLGTYIANPEVRRDLELKSVTDCSQVNAPPHVAPHEAIKETPDSRTTTSSLDDEAYEQVRREFERRKPRQR